MCRADGVEDDQSHFGIVKEANIFYAVHTQSQSLRNDLSLTFI